MQGLPHYRVSTDFVLQADDVLYLTGDYKQAQLFAEVVGYQLLDSETELERLPAVEGKLAAESAVDLKKAGLVDGVQPERLLIQVL